MRTIPGTLTSAQKSLSTKPVFAVTVDTEDVTDTLLAYRYTEPGQLLIVLNNQTHAFNTPPAYIHAGAPVVVSRGIDSNLAALPTYYLEEYFYTYGKSRATLVLICIDWKERLRRWNSPDTEAWTAESAQTICEWILDQVGLTLMSGSLTELTTNFTIRQGESGLSALNRLMQRLPEFLYAGLDSEIKFKILDPEETTAYTFDWNRQQSQHPCLSVEAGTTAWEYNAVEFTGTGASGSASDATQQASVGIRQKTIVDPDLTADADCEQAAKSELSYYAAHAEEMTIVCRPCHGLEQFDVITLDNPPWGGANATARVIRISEQHAPGIWRQTISCGKAANKPGGHLSALAQSVLGNTNWEFYFYLTTLIENYITTMVPDILPEDLVYGGGSGAENLIAFWQNPWTLTSNPGLAVDPANDLLIAKGLRNAENTIRVQVNANGSIQVNTDGNARGAGAVDLQTARESNTDVPSHPYSFTSGYSNEASSLYAHARGYRTRANAIAAFAEGYRTHAGQHYSHAEGYLTQTLGEYSHAEGYSTRATGSAAHAEGAATIAGGYSAHAEGDSSRATGQNSHAEGALSLASLRCEHAHSSGCFNTVGDAQLRRFVVKRAITSHIDSSWYTLSLDTPSPIVRLIIPTDTLWQFDIMLIGLTQGAAQQWSYRLQGTVVNYGGTVTLLGTTVKSEHTESDAAYDARATASVTNKSLDIQVCRNGGSNYSIRWVAVVQVVQASFPA